jgi:hypothetical protein
MKKIFFVTTFLFSGAGFAAPVTYSYEAPYSCQLKGGNPETGVLKDTFVLDSDKSKDVRNPKTEAVLQAGNKLNAKYGPGKCTLMMDKIKVTP